jgi:hypothetical protein
MPQDIFNLNPDVAALARSVAQSAVQAVVPPFASTVPMSEAKVASTGEIPAITRPDHQHPRLTSSTVGITAAGGTAFVPFTRTFNSVPSMTFTAIEDNTTPIPDFKVQRFLKQDMTSKWNGVADGPIYGCVIYAERARTLPVLAPLSGLLTLLSGVITGVNGLAAQLNGFLPTEPAAGVNFTCIAVASSA